jgi:hypothetical protein
MAQQLMIYMCIFKVTLLMKEAKLFYTAHLFIKDLPVHIFLSSALFIFQAFQAICCLSLVLFQYYFPTANSTFLAVCNITIVLASYRCLGSRESKSRSAAMSYSASHCCSWAYITYRCFNFTNQRESSQKYAESTSSSATMCSKHHF